ncbi:hypothetical protein [Siminovitchia fortis]|uniref:hypothetical protein n=1 Tax=Siminovitchia fortis TaxID=254758 RepID=UPI001643EDC7|nr:hypothetical protein [Siminovitchia fortis]
MKKDGSLWAVWHPFWVAAHYIVYSCISLFITAAGYSLEAVVHILPVPGMAVVLLI